VFPLGSQFLRERLQRVCDSFQGDRFDLPKARDEIIERLSRSKSVLENLYNTLEFTIDNFKKYLISIQ
jgi:hypothetical protein